MTTAAPTSDDTVLPPPEERPERAVGWSRESKQLGIALACALLLHFLPVLYVLGKWAVVGGAPSSEEDIGDPNGESKGVNVEMIDATEFNEKYTSFGKGKEVASSLDEKPQPAKPEQKLQPPTPQQPASKQATPQKPVEQKLPQQKPPELKQAEQKQAEQKPTEERTNEQKPTELKTPLKEPPKEAAEKPEEVADLDTPGLPAPPPPKPKPTEQAKEAATAPPPSPASPQSQQMTEQEVTEAFEEASKNKVEAAAGKAQSGRVSPFVRSTQRKLFLGTPVFSNEKGTVTVFLIIGMRGEIALLRIVESSGNPTIDNAVIAGIRTQHFDVPPPGTTPKERAVVATYEY